MAYYAEKDFFEDDELIQLVTSILEGNLTLDWYRVDTPRVRARRRGVSTAYHSRVSFPSRIPVTSSMSWSSSKKSFSA